MVGERIVERYIKHPAAATGWLDDGAPLDAGSVHIAHSNISHLAERNVRLIGHAVGFGALDVDDATFVGIVDVSTDASDTLSQIPWARERSAAVFGPVVLAHTRIGTSPAGYYPRSVRVIVQAYKGADVSTDLTMLAVLTAGPGSPLRADRYTSTSVVTSDASAGAVIVDMTLSIDEPVRPSSSWRARASGTAEPASTGLTPAWVWVGWHSSTSAVSADPDRVESVSVFEVRDG